MKFMKCIYLNHAVVPYARHVKYCMLNLTMHN